MRRAFYFAVVLAGVLTLAGCESNKTRIGEGAGIGGAVGALAGGILGYQSGHPLQGAAIGAAVGGGTGALVGSQIKKPTTTANSVQTSTQITMQQIVDWTKQGLTSEQIIAKIKEANPKYNLTSEDISYLAGQGVSQRVIETMQAYK